MDNMLIDKQAFLSVWYGQVKCLSQIVHHDGNLDLCLQLRHDLPTNARG